MALRDAQVILLCEDQMQQNFAYWWLRERGVSSSKITRIPLPAGAQAGEQYVRQRFAIEVRSFRSRAARMALALITVIDADRGTVEQRLQQLNDALREMGLPERVDAEMICLLVPRRNIETWIHFALTPPADEETDYKPKFADECKEAARRLSRWTVVPEAAPASIVQGMAELDRLRTMR